VDSFEQHYCRSPVYQEEVADAQEAEGGGGEEESFHLGGDLWNVYESEGYPYYLRMRDSHSQWDDPRTHGVEGEEAVAGAQEEAAQAAAAAAVHQSVPSPVPAASFYKQPAAMVSPVAESKQEEISSFTPYSHPGIRAVQQQQQQQSAHSNQLMSPTMTSPSKAGVGATFIKVNTGAAVNAADAKQTFLSSQPIHAETKNAPLQRISPHQLRPAPIKTAEEIFSEAKSDEDLFVDAPAEAKEVKEEAPEKKEAEEKKTASTSQALGKEDLAADPDMAKFVKQAKMGVPPPAIVAKMLGDGIESSKVNAFRRVFGLPVEDQRETPKPVLTKTLTKEELAADPDMAKFVKQAKMGVPPPAIVAKMVGEGIAGKKINGFRRTFGLPVADEEEESEEAAEEPVLSKEELAADPDLAKFVKQAKMGVPPAAIVNKMRGEGVADAKVESFERTFGLATASKTKKKKQPPLPTMPRRTTVKMQKVHWNAVDESKLQGSVWGANEEELGKDDITELEGIFGEAKMGSPKGGGGPSGKKSAAGAKASGQPELSDGKRAYNVNIGLVQFKAIFGEDYEALVAAVLDLDGATLGAERVNNLRSLLPNDYELKEMQNAKWKGADEAKLGKCERFFLAVSRVKGGGAKVSKIVGSLSIVLSFGEGVEEVESGTAVLGLACSQIVKSKRLGVLLKKVLAVGNLMNESVGKPKASGITLESLLKTAELKGKDKKTTVLDYVVKMIGEKGEDEGVKMLSGLAQEMGDLAAGARCKGMREMEAIVTDLKAGVKGIEKLLGGEGENTAKFVERGDMFVKDGVGKIEALEEKLKVCGSKVKTLCGYFAEDYERCDPANIMKVLIQFIRMVGNSWEMYQRKARAAARNAAKEQAAASSQQPAKLSVDTSLVSSPAGKTSGMKWDGAGSRTPQTPMTPQTPVTPMGQEMGGGGRFNQDLLLKAMQSRRSSIQGGESPDVVKGGRAEGGGGTSEYKSGAVDSSLYESGVTGDGGFSSPFAEGKEDDDGNGSDSSDDWLDAKD
jgi:hypothetical protein